jgi:hypothetical protein
LNFDFDERPDLTTRFCEATAGEPLAVALAAVAAKLAEIPRVVNAIISFNKFIIYLPFDSDLKV